MFKRVKEGLKKIRELYKNPKTHDIVSLTLWLLFIIIVIVFFRVTTFSKPTTNNENTYTTSVNSYEFTYNFENTNINGVYYKSNMLFYLNNNKYYTDDSIYLVNGTELNRINDFDLKALKISYEFITKATKNVSKRVVDGYNVYTVPLDTFISLYDNDISEDIESTKNYNVIIKTKEKNNLLSSVIIDMSNYYIYKGIDVNYPVTIYFYNINNISDFTKEYKEMLGVIK